jgi:ABC-type dipeptide/oligopeptide/nickel transport system permease component
VAGGLDPRQRHQLTAVFILFSGFLSDVLYAVLDPRVRVS